MLFGEIWLLEVDLLGFLGSAYFYPYALMQFPAGLLSDYWGLQKNNYALLLWMDGADLQLFPQGNHAAIIANVDL